MADRETKEIIECMCKAQKHFERVSAFVSLLFLVSLITFIMYTLANGAK